MADTMDIYFKQLSKTKLLTAEEEVFLSQRIEAGDKIARCKMIESNMRLAVSIAKRYAKSGAQLEDLIQESNVGLIKAVDRFDWRRGFKFSTYASWWIKQAVRRHVNEAASDIKVPPHTLAHAYRINTFVREYEDEFGVRPSDAEIGAMVGISEDAVKEVMVSCGLRNLVQLDAHIGDSDGKSFSETVPDENGVNIEDELDRIKILAAIKASLDSLTPREEQVLRLRFGVHEVDREKFIVQEEK
jgi:RNA polymerase primary sigma factor